MLRPVALSSGVAGELYLDAMPGRREPWASSRAAISGQGIGRVVSLASLDEIREKSHGYTQAIESKDLP